MALINALSVIHAIVSVLLILFVLIHFGKGAEAGLVLDTNASSILPQKGNILNKITTVLAIIFLTLAFVLSVLRGKSANHSIMDNAKTTTSSAATSPVTLPVSEPVKVTEPAKAAPVAPVTAPANAPAPTTGK